MMTVATASSSGIPQQCYCYGVENRVDGVHDQAGQQHGAEAGVDDLLACAEDSLPDE